MVVNSARPVDEIWLERHGNIVKQAFSMVAGGSDILVMETFLDNQQDAPQPGRFPTRDNRGPIPTAIP